MNGNEGTVFNIQRFTVHDGPGIRTEIFLKGCTLKCKWCSNPESICLKKEVGIYKAKCINTKICGGCEKVCPTNSLIKNEEGFIIGINRKTCIGCQECAAKCPSGCLKKWGNVMTVKEVMTEIMKDYDIMKSSGGGVTFNGGEVLVQKEFLRQLLIECKANNLHTCIETALNVPLESIKSVQDYVDLFIFDLKEIVSDKHKAFTGYGNTRILENAKYISSLNLPFVVRLPYVPNHNGTKENAVGIGNFINNEMIRKPAQLQVLRFRELGEEKYVSLDLKYPMKGVDNRESFEREIHDVVGVLQGMGIKAVAGTTQKYSCQ